MILKISIIRNLFTRDRNYLWTLNRRIRKVGFEVVRYPTPTYLSGLVPEMQRVISKLPTEKRLEINPILIGATIANQKGLSPNAQLGQDLYVLGSFKEVDGPFFYLEIGAYHPIEFSNTAILRMTGYWNGLSVDPNPNSKESFRQYGLSERFLEAAIGSEEGLFGLIENGALSKMETSVTDKSSHKVRMITPRMLLSGLSRIDYLSLDIEGGELEVLLNWPWESHKPKIITVEHNHRASDKQAIRTLLEKNNYRCVLGELTEFENWFILE